MRRVDRGGASRSEEIGERCEPDDQPGGAEGDCGGVPTGCRGGGEADGVRQFNIFGVGGMITDQCSIYCPWRGRLRKSF